MPFNIFSLVWLSLALSSFAQRTVTNVTVFSPPSDYLIPRVLYARTVQLEDGSLLATWENYSPEPPKVYFPIYHSTDKGATWKHISNVTDTQNGWGLRYQPFLYLLPKRVGHYPAGTILCAGNSIPTDLNYTKIDVYASLDQGKSWSFVSNVATGGKALPDNGLTPIWEPFFYLYSNTLTIYYSDQRSPLYGQKLVHQTSTDLKTWNPAVDDVHYAPYTARPGMTTVTRIANGSYMMTYEYGGGPPSTDSNYLFPAYYRISDSPLTFLDKVGFPVKTPDGTIPTSSPYVTWTPYGGKNGTIVVSTGNDQPIFINQRNGEVDGWREIQVPQGVSYTRHLRVLQEKGGQDLLIMGGGPLGGEDNRVVVSVLDLKRYLPKVRGGYGGGV